MLMRGPTGADVLGTACSQVRWQDPPITSRSPCACGSRNDGPLAGRARRRMANVRVAPRLMMATMVSSELLRPMVSPCQATLSEPSR